MPSGDEIWAPARRVVEILQRKIDKEGLADDGGAWDEAPVPAVLAVVAVVAEDEIAI